MRLPPMVAEVELAHVGVSDARVDVLHRQIGIGRDQRQRRRKVTSFGRTSTRNTPLMMRVASSSPSQHRVTPAGRRIGFERQIRVLHRPLDAAVERDAEDIGEAEVLALLAALVVERAREGGEQAAAALRRSARIAAHCASESAAASARMSSLNPSEAIGRQKRLVHELEGQRVLRSARDTCRGRDRRRDRREPRRHDRSRSAPNSSSATRASGASLRR